jgi:hypothetical protein
MGSLFAITKIILLVRSMLLFDIVRILNISWARAAEYITNGMVLNAGIVLAIVRTVPPFEKAGL